MSKNPPSCLTLIDILSMFNRISLFYFEFLPLSLHKQQIPTQNAIPTPIAMSIPIKLPIMLIATPVATIASSSEFNEAHFLSWLSV